MPTKKIVGIDIDGVLADFNKAYSHLSEKLNGNNLGRTTDYTVWPPCWAYEPVFGLTPQEVGGLWKEIEGSDFFWQNLDILQSPETLDKVAKLSWRKDVDLYFITARPGRSAKVQTEAWLSYRVGVRNPTVLISSQKGFVASGLGITHFLDDNAENCIDVKVALRKRGEVFCLSAPYNKEEHFKMQSIGINIIQRLEEFIDRI